MFIRRTRLYILLVEIPVESSQLILQKKKNVETEDSNNVSANRGMRQDCHLSPVICNVHNRTWQEMYVLGWPLSKGLLLFVSLQFPPHMGMRWVGHVARRGRREMLTKLWRQFRRQVEVEE